MSELNLTYFDEKFDRIFSELASLKDELRGVKELTTKIYDSSQTVLNSQVYISLAKSHSFTLTYHCLLEFTTQRRQVFKEQAKVDSKSY